MRYGMMTVFLKIMLEQALVQNVFIKRILTLWHTFENLKCIKQNKMYFFVPRLIYLAK